MVADVTSIIIAAAAVFGLVPLGVRTIHDMIKNHRRKKTSEMMLTVALSVIASHTAPAVLTDLAQRLGAVAEQLPPWAKAALGSIPQPTPEAEAEPATQTLNDATRTPEPTQDGHGPD